MKDLNELRKQIDEIDKEIAGQFLKRLSISKEVAEYKKESGKGVYDKKREQEKIEKLSLITDDDFQKEDIRELFSQIMSISRKLQYRLIDSYDKDIEYEMAEEIPMDKKTVVYFGTSGSYAQKAMESYFGKDTDSFARDTFQGVMDALKEGRAQYGVLPIENSSTGGISDIYDLLVKYDNTIIGEQIVKIDQALLALPGAKLADIKTVYSHPQGIKQCVDFLRENPQISAKEISSTAAGAKKVKEDNDISKGAIAGIQAAELFGLNVLKEKINFASNNSTRFIIITGEKIYLKKADRVSICFELPHECGSLYNMLSHISYNNLNMTNIESRPIAGRRWEYRFFIDFEGSLSDPAVKNMLNGMRAEASYFRILGNYKSGRGE